MTRLRLTPVVEAKAGPACSGPVTVAADRSVGANSNRASTRTVQRINEIGDREKDENIMVVKSSVEVLRLDVTPPPNPSPKRRGGGRESSAPPLRRGEGVGGGVAPMSKLAASATRCATAAAA